MSPMSVKAHGGTSSGDFGFSARVRMFSRVHYSVLIPCHVGFLAFLTHCCNKSYLTFVHVRAVVQEMRSRFLPRVQGWVRQRLTRCQHCSSHLIPPERYFGESGEWCTSHLSTLISIEFHLFQVDQAIWRLRKSG